MVAQLTLGSRSEYRENLFLKPWATATWRGLQYLSIIPSVLPAESEQKGKPSMTLHNSFLCHLRAIDGTRSASTHIMYYSRWYNSWYSRKNYPREVTPYPPLPIISGITFMISCYISSLIYLRVNSFEHEFWNQTNTYVIHYCNTVWRNIFSNRNLYINAHLVNKY